jgi:hypothetical protein
LSRTEDGDVLTPAVGKATEPVEELQLRTRRGRLAPGLPRTGRRCGRSDPLGRLQADDLIGETTPAAQQDGPGGRLEERAVFGGELVAAQDDVHAAAVRMALVDENRLARPHEGLERVVEVLGVGRWVFVEDHEVDIEELEPPVLVRTQ